ncbi:MAG: hypothetical protein C0483_02990 [Pirellula sp.]|nr:hypothetical protein [Pirellula sp.]
MTFLQAFLVSLSVLGLCNIAAFRLLKLLRRRGVNSLESAFCFSKECIRRIPVLRGVAIFVYRLLPVVWPRMRAKYLRHLCQSLMTQDYCEAAIAQCGRTLNAFPLARDAYIMRGSALRRLGRYDEALQDFQAALVLPERSGEESRALYHQLAQLMLKRGKIESALFFSWARLEIERGNIVPITVSPMPTEEQFQASLNSLSADHMQILIEAHSDLAEEIINAESNFEVALDIYDRRETVQHEYRKNFGLERMRHLYLPDDWVRNIGHIALLDFLLKMKHLGWTDWEDIVVLAPPSRVANANFLEHWKKHFTVISDAHLIASLTPLAQALGQRVAGLLRLPNGRVEYFCDAMGEVQEAWEKQDRPPLLTVSAQDEDSRRGRQCLAAMGVPSDAWFVVLHVRSPGYHREGSNPQQAHRNADVKSYLPAIEEIVSRGGWVIRLGDPSMEPLPQLHGVVDYAHSRFKSDWMDIFLISNSRFFLGVASGLCSVPCAFGVPSLMTNWVSNHLPVYGRRDLFIPKLCWSDREQRLLSFDEFYHPTVRRLGYSCLDLAREGLRVLENSPEEIREAVREMCDMLDGNDQTEERDLEMEKSFQTIVNRHGLRGHSRIGKRFLRTHADLLPKVYVEASQSAA